MHRNVESNMVEIYFMQIFTNTKQKEKKKENEIRRKLLFKSKGKISAVQHAEKTNTRLQSLPQRRSRRVSHETQQS